MSDTTQDRDVSEGHLFDSDANEESIDWLWNENAGTSFLCTVLSQKIEDAKTKSQQDNEDC